MDIGEIQTTKVIELPKRKSLPARSPIPRKQPAKAPSRPVKAPEKAPSKTGGAT